MGSGCIRSFYCDTAIGIVIFFWKIKT
jgi:hypothetical protein